MSRMIFHPDARQDLDAIADFIARDNEDRAISFIRDLQIACMRYADYPLSGRDCSHIFPGLRRFPHGNYLVYYRLEAENQGIEILHVLHGARDHERIMRDG